MPDIYDRLRAFNEAHPLLRERDEALRKALGELEGYQKLCQVAGVLLGADVFDAVEVLRFAKQKLNSALLEHIALENELFNKE